LYNIPLLKMYAFVSLKITKFNGCVYFPNRKMLSNGDYALLATVLLFDNNFFYGTVFIRYELKKIDTGI
jgi:hypothetical protein